MEMVTGQKVDLLLTIDYVTFLMFICHLIAGFRYNIKELG